MSPHAFQRTFMRAALRLGLVLLVIHGVLVTLALLGSDGCARVIVLLDAPFVLGAAAIIGGERDTLPVLVMLIGPLAGTVVYAALGALAYAWVERRNVRSDVCSRCGYPLNGSTICPECGTVAS